MRSKSALLDHEDCNAQTRHCERSVEYVGLKKGSLAIKLSGREVVSGVGRFGMVLFDGECLLPINDPLVIEWGRGLKQGLFYNVEHSAYLTSSQIHAGLM
jgi:hypothetical protein